jgi:hypothetical protein
MNKIIKDKRNLDKEIQNIEKEDEYSELNLNNHRELKDNSKKQYCKIFFDNSENRFLFLDFVYEKLLINFDRDNINNMLYEQYEFMLTKEEEIHLLFKGGNIMNYYFEKYFKEIKGICSETTKILNSIKESFETSDYDFSILIMTENREINRFNNIKHICTQILSDNLTIIAKEFELLYTKNKFIGDEKMDKLVKEDFYCELKKRKFVNEITKTLNEKVKKKFYKKDVFGNILKIEIFNEIKEIDIEIKKSNFFIVTQKNGFEKINDEGIYYLSYNSSIYSKKHIYITNFDLGRIKKYVVANHGLMIDGEEKEYNIPSEFIDVTIIGIDDDCGLKIKKEDIEDITFKNKKNECLKIKSFSIKYLICDLSYTLFVDTGYQPWVNNKYLKRIERLIFFYKLYNIKCNRKLKDLIEIVDICITKLDDKINQTNKHNIDDTNFINKINTFVIGNNIDYDEILDINIELKYIDCEHMYKCILINTLICMQDMDDIYDLINKLRERYNYKILSKDELYEKYINKFFEFLKNISNKIKILNEIK